MGLILDTSVLIAGERKGGTVQQILRTLASRGDAAAALSAISVVELTHGIYRARSEDAMARRQRYVDEVFRTLPVHPITFEIARLAGQIEGEQAAKGNVIAFEDLLIGATALHLGWEVVTLNVSHFERIPGLTVQSL